jgi:hypothetical protein
VRPPLRRLLRTLTGGGVEDTASCARALTAMAGRLPAPELLPGGAAEVSRALLTARVIAASDPMPWPNPIRRQLDPDDPAYLPGLGLHPVLAARDQTLLGLPDHERVAWVDPSGWCGVGEGPAFTCWFGEEGDVGPLALERAEREAGDPRRSCAQGRSDTGVGVRTVARRGRVQLVLVYWPTLLDGQLAFAMHARLNLLEGPPAVVRLGFAIRPQGFGGSAPLFRLERDLDGLWSGDGEPLMAVAQSGDEVITARFGEPDPLAQLRAGHGARPGRVDLRCPAGQASAVELWRARLDPEAQLTRLAVLLPPRGAPSAIVRTSGPSLWSAANADRTGLLPSACPLQLSAHQDVFEACRVRLLMGDHDEQVSLAGALGALALARMGFQRRACDRLGRWLSQVDRGGRYPGDEAEDGALLAWAAAEVVSWTGDRHWLDEHKVPLGRLCDHLSKASPGPGGRALFGPEGSARWTAIWRIAALLRAASSWREAPGRDRWALAGGASRESLAQTLGPAPWSASPGRATDGSAAALLAAVWLGLLPPTDPAVGETARVLRASWTHGGGVLLFGGAHVAATALLVSAEARRGSGIDPLPVIAALAGPTGALPTARHPARGAVGEGDDPLSAAVLCLLALDRVLVGHGELRVLPGLVSARDLPTPYGKVDVFTEADGTRRVVGRWRGPAPTVRVLDRV